MLFWSRAGIDVCVSHEIRFPPLNTHIDLTPSHRERICKQDATLERRKRPQSWLRPAKAIEATRNRPVLTPGVFRPNAP
jgi:hypothetical protein